MVLQYVFIIGILLHATLADIPDCDFRDTVNITGYPKHANGSYTYEGVIIPVPLVGTYDYVLTAGGEEREAAPRHTRGCVCKVKPCVQFCCPLSTLKVPDELACRSAIDVAFDYDPFINVTTAEGETRLMHVHNEFVFQHHVPCASPLALTHEGETWQFFQNGSLYSDMDDLSFTKQNYCMHLYEFEIDNGTFYELTPLICLPPQPPLSLELLLNTIVMAISIVCFIITIFVYAFVPELRNLHGKCLICHLLAMTGGFSVLIFNNLKPALPDDICIGLGILCYFFLIMAFLWLSVISFDLWNSFRGTTYNIHRLSQRRKFYVYSVYACGITILLTGLTVAAEYLYPSSIYSPNIVHTCFIDIQRWSAMIYLFGPMALLVLFNTIMFALTALQIYRVQKEVQRMVDSGNRETSRLGREKDNFGLFLRLFLVMGVLWIFEVISYLVGTDSNLYQILRVTDMLNAGKGVIILLLFVCKRKIWKLLKKRILRRGTMTTETECSIDEVSLQELYLTAKQQIAEQNTENEK